MFERCYSEAYHETRPTYKGCSVHKDWHNYQVFYKWAVVRYKKGYHLDKDILYRGNKVYSQTACSFVPQRINSIVTDNVCRRGECAKGVSKRKKKGTQEYNGLFTVACGTGISGGTVYLGRTTCEFEGFERYKEFKEQLLYDFGDTYYERGLITKEVSDALKAYVVNFTD